jgi:hypothetical protein
MSKKLPPISAPLDRRWREFRVQYLPLVAFAISVAAAIVLWGKFAVPQQLDPTTSDSVETSLQLPLDEEDGAVGNLVKVCLPATNSVDSGFSD